MVYFTKSNLELESEDDGDEAPKKRSFNKKKANATDSNSDKFDLGPNADDENKYITANTLLESVSEAEDEEKGSKVSPPVDEDNEDENLDFDHLKFGMVTNLTVRYGLVCANTEEVQEMIKYVMDHGKAIRIVHLNPEVAGEINRIGKRLLRTKMCRISTTNRASLGTWSRPTNDTIVCNASDVKAVEDTRLS